jgi:hypothetical protein
MTSFEEELRRAYHPSQPTREKQLEEAQADLQRGRGTARLWPEQRELVKGRILPRLKGLRRSMRQARKPKDVRDLNRAYNQFNNLRLITWWQPQALWLRVRMLFFVGSLFIVGMLLLALVGLLIWGMLRAIMAIIDATGGWLG